MIAQKPKICTQIHTTKQSQIVNHVNNFLFPSCESKPEVTSELYHATALNTYFLTLGNSAVKPVITVSF